MEQIFSPYKKRIDKRLLELSQELANLDLAWSDIVSKQIVTSTIRGKTVRGALVLLTIDLFNKPIKQAEITVAAALEYLHTALLIHDDIMDNDDIRRGLPSTHKYYEQLGLKLQATNAKNLGTGLAICTGDIAIFAANWFIARNNKISPATRLKILDLVGEEYCRVGLGQMQDLLFAQTPKIPSTEDVLAMYTNKTARYTFSLPLMIGGLLADQHIKTLKILDEIGLTLGLIFQLTDDALTLHGNSQEIGKNIGNDIAENKKTLYHVLLVKKANQNDKKIINSIFGKKNIKETDIKKIKRLLINYQVEPEIEILIKAQAQQARLAINKLPLEPAQKDSLITLINYLLVRTK